MNANIILEHYLIAALWTSELDSLTLDNIDKASKDNALSDIIRFMKKAGDLLNGLDASQVGHDFWLTRNRHGAGFWDRGLGEVGDKLTAICKDFTEVNVFEENGNVVID